MVPDPDVRVWEFTGAMISGSQPPPATAPTAEGGSSAGEPVDLGSGLFVSEKADMALAYALPLMLSRTYRPRDTNSYSFGIGTQSPYDIHLYSVTNYQSADLVLPAGTRVHYVRTSPGTGYIGAVYEATTTPGAFYRSTITWNGHGWDLRQRDGTVYVFGDAAPLQAIRDRYGNQITLTHQNGQYGNITKVTSAHRRWIAFTYNAQNRITQARDNGQRTVSYSYDATGHLATATNLDGGTTTYAYSPGGEMTSITSPTKSTFVTNTYDANGRVSTQTLADGATYQFAYTTDANGKVTQTLVTDPRGNQRRVSFDSSGYTTTDTEGLGSPQEATTSFARQANTGLLTSVTDPLSRRTDFAYDPLGNATSLTRLAGTSDATTSTFAYEPTYSQPMRATDPTGKTTTYTYDNLGELTAITDPLGNATTLAYADQGGLPTAITDPLQHTTTLTYSAGDLASVREPLGNTATRYTDALGRVLSTTDPMGRISRYAYDNSDRLTQITDPTGAQTTLAYDADGNLTDLTDARGSHTSATYDGMDRISSQTDPLGHAASFGYDLNGNLTTATDRAGRTTTYRYDPLNRRTFAGYDTFPDGQSFASTQTYSYDTASRLTAIADSAGGSLTNAYDGLDRLTSQTQPTGTVSYGYDAAGRRTTMDAPGQPTTGYSYDAAGRLTGIARDTNTVALAYDAASRLTSTTLPNGLTTRYTYDAADRPTQLAYQSALSTIGELDYAYDQDGRRSAEWGTWAHTNVPASIGVGTYNAANQLTTRDGSTYTYNPDDNLTGDGTTAYQWDARGELTQATKAGSNDTFTYDATGRRASQTYNGETTSYLYDHANIRQEQATGGTAKLLGGLGMDELFSREDAGGTSYLLSDVLGSTAALSDGLGAVQTSYTYGPFGQTTSSGAPATSPFQYTGREADPSGLYYNRARYYDPTTARFISADPLGSAGSGTNLYAYANNDPVDLTDPTGEHWIEDAVNAYASGVDTATLGITRTIRQSIGSDGANYCSAAYGNFGIGPLQGVAGSIKGYADNHWVDITVDIFEEGGGQGGVVIGGGAPYIHPHGGLGAGAGYGGSIRFGGGSGKDEANKVGITAGGCTGIICKGGFVGFEPGRNGEIVPSKDSGWGAGIGGGVSYTGGLGF